MGTRRAAALAMGLSVLGAWTGRSRLAFAAAASVGVAYEAGEGCPAASEFAAAVASRGRSIVIVDDDSLATMRIAIVVTPKASYRGTLRMGPSDAIAREVSGATCRQVLDALAVIAVSSLGPAQSTTSGAVASAAPPASPADRAPTDAAVAPVPKPEPAPLQAGNIGTAPREMAVGPGTVRFDRDIAMTVFGGVQTGLVPGIVLPRFDFEVARTNLVTSPEGTTVRVVPTVRLHLSFFPDDASYHSSYGTTSAGGYGLGADLCAPLYYDRRGVSFLLCGEFMGGYFGLQTTSLLGTKGPTKLAGFGTGGLGLDLAYNLGRHVHLGLKTGAGFVIGDLTAEAPDGSEIFKSSIVTFHGLLGVGGQF